MVFQLVLACWDRHFSGNKGWNKADASKFDP